MSCLSQRQKCVSAVLHFTPLPWNPPFCLYGVGPCDCVSVFCMLRVKALVSLVLGDRKHTAMRAQVSYLFLESVWCIRVSLACIF